MQQQQELDSLCPEHGGENENQQFRCLKCQMQQQMPIEQEFDQTSQKILNLEEERSESQKRLESLKKLILNSKESFVYETNQIIKKVNNEIDQMNLNIEQEIDELNLTKVGNHITEKDEQQQQTSRIQQDKEFISEMIDQYITIVKSQIKQIEQAGWKMQNHIIEAKEPLKVINEDSNQQNQLLKKQPKLPKYKLFYKEKKNTYLCSAITMDKDERILVVGKSDDILIWNFNSDGTLELKQTLCGHTYPINSLQFSKKEYWFISGDFEGTMRIWVRMDNDQWICTQILDSHGDEVNDIVINNDEDQLISCSDDQTIKVWMKPQGETEWKCVQTLTEHQYSVKFLSLSPDCNLLASSGEDNLRIWRKGENQLWKQHQVIDLPMIDRFLRLKFIDNNELLTSFKYEGKLFRLTQNKQGLFQIISELKFNKGTECIRNCFPMIYNSLLRLVIVRNNENVTYILKQQKDGEFIIHQVLNGNYKAGYLTQSGNYLIMYDDDDEDEYLGVWKQ